MHTADADRLPDTRLAHWLSEAVLRYPSATAVRDRDGDHTYRSLDSDVDSVREALRATGIRRGDRVGLVGRNSALSIAVFLACARGGWVCAPLSFRSSPTELAHAINRLNPAVVVVDDEFVGRLRHGGEHTVQGRIDDRGARLVVRHAAVTQVPRLDSRDDANPAADDAPVLMVATSGTSGAPKYAVLNHRQCWWANLMLAEVFPTVAGDVVLSVMPQHHVGGWNAFTLLSLHVGATLVLPADFREGEVLRSIEHEGVVTMMGVPTHYQRLASDPAFGSRDLTTLTTALVGGAPVPATLRESWRSRGVVLREGYGLTEAGPHVLIEDLARDASPHASWFVPYPNVEVRIIDPDTAAVIDGPGVGELGVRSPAVFTGYFRDDEATRDARTDGWLRTGDRGERDTEGRYRIIDRLNDIIISGGENIAPAEVESVIATHRDVRDVLVVGVGDERWGEVPVALVVSAADASADVADELRTLCRENLAPFKVPTRVYVVDALPRTDLGKARRAAARAMLDTVRLTA